MAKGKYLGDFEQLVLLAVMRLEGGAYGMTVRREIEQQADRSVSLGAIYATLDRLEEKGLLSSNVGDPTEQRRGRAKRFFRVEAPGVHALQSALAALDRMRRGIKEVEQPAGVGP